MLNKCTDKIWAVVELCESIRPQKVSFVSYYVILLTILKD